MAGQVHELTDDTFQQDVLQSDQPVLVDFWAPWCQPCRIVAPVVEDLSTDYRGRARVCKLNVDEHTQTASRYRVMSIPTLILFKGGQEVDRVVGVAPKTELAKRLDAQLT